MCRFRSVIAVCVIALLVSCSSNCALNDSETPKASYYKITVNDKAGFIDANGKIIIEPQFDYAYDRFTEDVCYARVGDRQGLIDQDGNFIVELADSVEYVYNFINGFAKFNCGYEKKRYN